jgi:D-lactate dehydrogenase
LHAQGVKHIALRSAGFNHVHLATCETLGMSVARVPAYSPHAVAEHAVALILMLNRQLHRAFNRTREHNFSLDGLMGFDMAGKTVGVIGLGRIGQVFAKIMLGFSCRVLGFDPLGGAEAAKLGVTLVDLPQLLRESNIISLHCPLNPSTHHLINAAAIAQMLKGVMIINTSRGAIVDSKALIAGLKSRHIGAVGLDVYEEEGDLFFRDLSNQVLQDDTLARLLTFPNAVITAHQGFLTKEALHNIAETTLANLNGFAKGQTPAENLVRTSAHVAR